MTLIKSISGIRGTIGGQPGDNLTPIDLVKFTTAYARWLKEVNPAKTRLSVVLGRDARISGEMTAHIVKGTLLGCGINVLDIGLATTPTVEIAVTGHGADGGIILTASHNPKQWNALKLLNAKGEFLDDEAGKTVLRYAESGELSYPDVEAIGQAVSGNYDRQHIEAVLALPLCRPEAVRQAGFKVVVDAVNSVGGIVIPQLLKELGVEVVEMNCTPDGQFAHNPEPIPEHLKALSAKVVEHKADLGIAVDPDVDRLALVCEDGAMFGEEYTLVAVADYVLSKTPGATVSNLSSSRALRDVTESHGCQYFTAAVGEVNVVEVMKRKNAVIGGEGNGGIIYPELHYGRDALVGVALFLSLLAKRGLKASELRAVYPEYHISKNKIELTPDIDVDGVLVKIKQKYAAEQVTDIDGVKIDFPEKWVHLRKSNTEPIIRIYSEAKTATEAEALANSIIDDIKVLI